MNQKIKLVMWAVLLILGTIIIMYVSGLNKHRMAVEQEKRTQTMEELATRVDLLEHELNEMRLLKITEDEKAKTRYYPTTVIFLFLALLMVIVFIFYAKTAHQLQLLKKEMMDLKKNVSEATTFSSINEEV